MGLEFPVSVFSLGDEPVAMTPTSCEPRERGEPDGMMKALAARTASIGEKYRMLDGCDCHSRASY